MADYLSAYTGQQIDTILGSVSDKISKNDVINDFAVNDPLFPPSSRLTYELNIAIEDINDTLANKVIRTDGGDQNINGRKKFISVLDANGGIVVPTGKTVTIADEPTNNSDAVNLSMMKKHGVSEDTAGVGSGLSISLLANGYNQLVVDATRLNEFTGASLPTFLMAQFSNGTRKWAFDSFMAAMLADSRFNVFVKTVDYDADMLSLENQITAINTSLAGKVNTSTYNVKMTALDASITSLTNGKVDNTTYNAKMTALDLSITDLGTNKVNVTTYNAKMTSLDSDIAARVTLAKTNLSGITVSASGNTALPDFNLVNLCQILVSAKWGTVVDTYRVTITLDGTVKSEELVKKSTAGTVTFAAAVVSGKLRLTITNANTTTAASVDYNLVASF